MRYSIFFIFLFFSFTFNEVVPVCESDPQNFIELIQPILVAKSAFFNSESNNRLAILTTYNGVFDTINNYDLNNEVISLQMLPYGNSPLSIIEINIIQDWIDCE